MESKVECDTETLRLHTEGWEETIRKNQTTKKSDQVGYGSNAVVVMKYQQTLRKQQIP